jgi:hypothetical protein
MLNKEDLDRWWKGLPLAVKQEIFFCDVCHKEYH